jgi:hypothetical protein
MIGGAVLGEHRFNGRSKRLRQIGQVAHVLVRCFA